MKLVSLILLAALSIATFSNAQANDSAIPVIDVQGIHPHGKTEFEPIEFYGKDTVKFFKAMPEIATSTGNVSDEYRSVSIRSKNWAVGFYCSKEYIAPLTGEQKNDYMCTVSAYRLSADEYEGDTFPMDGFVPAIDGKEIEAKGINPYKNEQGDYISFYGKDAVKMATAVDGDYIYVYSKAYTFYMTCSKDYVHPLTQKTLSDYMCTVGFVKN